MTEVEQQFCKEMNSALEGVNADGQCIAARIIEGKVHFIFEYHEIEGEPTWLSF
jgi:hypothetical protein